MSKYIPLTMIAAIGLAACGGNDAAEMPQNDGVTVTVNGVTDTGTIYVALQNETAFGGATASYGTTVDASEASGGSVTATIAGVSAGDYAVAVFQDTNGNGTIDVGENGIPTEPWALSNGAGTQGAPSFDQAKISMSGSGENASVTLNK